MENILYLVHRIPYPPNKGDKIRSFNVLKHLSSRFGIVLGCFIDDPQDGLDASPLDKYCVEKNCIPLNPTIAKIKSLAGLLYGRALTLDYYANAEMQQWVSDVVKKHDISKVLVFSSSMAQFVEGDRFKDLHRVIDFVDVDSDKWRQYVDKTKFPMSWIYGREHKKLGLYEQQIAEEFNRSFLVTPDEVLLFQSFCPTQDIRDKIFVSENGVDPDYFNPENEFPPNNCKNPCLVFTGAMDYWANGDAVIWFVEKVWPVIIAKLPRAHLYIVGGNPSPSVLNLAKQTGVVVTGRVPDIRPYIAAANAVVAPLRIARGVQNKVLEAMAMDKLVIATSMAMEGIVLPANNDLDLFIHDDTAEMAASCISALQVECPSSKGKNRQFVIDSYAWPAKLESLVNSFTVN